jgi:hypothetical protein
VPVGGGSVVWLQLPGDAREHYIRARSGGSGDALVRELNRLQNTNRYLIAEPRPVR